MKGAIIGLFVVTLTCLFFSDQVESASLKMDPFWPEQRPGECPKFFGLPKCIRLDTSECVNDKDCGNVLQKCCSDGCKTFCLQVYF
ncbi:WAP four-disulfide core domain protein 18-like [Porites lutea]|uniref:WAP four-disulfide core domain protein 18-like n=1 Tax=Porites lutea TaxID=51062 RepID=UPI003CC58B8F